MIDLVAEMWLNSGAGTAIAVPFQAVAVEASYDMETLRNPTPTSVYRYYDIAGVLIYVGITKTGVNRNRQHNADKEWWQWVASQQVEHFPSRDVAHENEIALIQKYRPPFNKQHNHQYEALRAVYVAAREAGLYSDPTKEGLLGKRFKKLHVNAFVDPETGYAELRTRAEDAEAAARLVFTSGREVITNGGMTIGHVTAIERVGPIARILVRKMRKGFVFKLAHVFIKPLTRKGIIDYEISKVVALHTVDLLAAGRGHSQAHLDKKAAEAAARSDA